MVAAQAAVSPDAVALKAGAEVLSFAELERRSNQLARHLMSLGVGTDQPVGLCMQRSPSMVVAALAILKAGGAYVPLDSAIPAERLNFVLQDAGVGVLVTRGRDAEKVSTGSWSVVDLDRHADQIAACSSADFECTVGGENLAYVIYTSGSTGRPNGVEVTHAGLSNLVAWHCRTFQVKPQDRASHQAAVGFDAAVWEVWPYLAAGASVHMPDTSLSRDPKALQDWLLAEGISITFLASPLAEQMLALEWPRPCALRILLTGADTLHRRPSSEMPFILVNNYGPTECTVVATSGTILPGEDSMLPSIGCPIDHTQAYILDEQMVQVPVGTAGELYIGGAGVARGYHKRPELTAQRFVPNPFGSRSSDRLFRTGDLARYLQSGEIEFLGRMDDQIKIRGFRIEPNEIVRALQEHPQVESSTVLPRENPDGGKQLLAYVVLAPGGAPTAAALRQHLRLSLPDYMIPASFIRIGSMPLTPNGKIDRAALPFASGGNMLPEEDFVPPKGIVQQRVAAIIAALLRVERVGANDNFFLLGGHSLLGAQLITRIDEAFGIQLPLLQLFDHPTVAEISHEIEILILDKLETPTPTNLTATGTNQSVA
ncbi:MAG TPA: non-ribosomal peptide synthetase [Candidatus Aquilonibacter sp.]|nr:non-ribosomal peptide synthetase [Candidatus Aquilonibacter sp.]